MKADVELVVRAVRGQMRALGDDPTKMSAEQAHAVMDEMFRTEPTLIVSRWYDQATQEDLNKLYRAWRKWQRGS